MISPTEILYSFFYSGSPRLWITETINFILCYGIHEPGRNILLQTPYSQTHFILRSTQQTKLKTHRSWKGSTLHWMWSWGLHPVTSLVGTDVFEQTALATSSLSQSRRKTGMSTSNDHFTKRNLCCGSPILLLASLLPWPPLYVHWSRGVRFTVDLQ